MSRRKTSRPRRPYYKFPWTERASNAAREWRIAVVGKLTYREIARLLKAFDLVDQAPTAATVRRELQRLGVR